MAINFSNALGMHEQALMLRSQRTSLLANNIANANTPGLKPGTWTLPQCWRRPLISKKAST